MSSVSSNTAGGGGMGGLLGGIIPAITNVVPILGMITGDSQGNQGGGIGDLLGGKQSGGGGILGMLGGSSGGAQGSKGLVGGVMDLLGLTDILGGFGVKSDTAGSALNDADNSFSGADGNVSPVRTKNADTKGTDSKSGTIDAILSALGGGGTNGDAAALGGTDTARAAATASQTASMPVGNVPRLQPRASAGIQMGHTSSLPEAMEIPVIPM